MGPLHRFRHSLAAELSRPPLELANPALGNELGEDREMCSGVSGRCTPADVEPAVLVGLLYFDRTGSLTACAYGR
jgi:hypothetical protein